MAKDLWASTTPEEKALNKAGEEAFLAEISQKLKESHPRFDDAKAELAEIDDNEKRRKKLEEIIARYEVSLADIQRRKSTYEQEYSYMHESGKLEEDRHRVEGAIEQVRQEKEYFQTRLKHNDLDFSSFKRRANLKKLYYPFGLKDAALYTGLSKNTINKNPKKYGAEMSCVPYEYYPDRLDEVLADMKRTSPYWDFPELVIPAPGAWNRKGAEPSGPRKILWKGKAPDSQLRTLIGYWVDHRYVSLSSVEVGEYIAERFTTDMKDRRGGKHIHWLGGQKDLVAYLESLEDLGLLDLKVIGGSNYMAHFVAAHFRTTAKDGSIEPPKSSSLSVARSKVKTIYSTPGTSKERFAKRALEILNEVQKIARITKA